VEELARVLRSLGVLTYVSHSCLSLSERRAAEQAFAEGENCVIVATSTLELGIDVGDLDRVIQIDAPSSVSSFLQRIGRTGRRRGTSRNCLFLATKPQALLQTTALMLLWSEGYVEPIEPPALPLHIFAQQIMALALQEQGLGIADWPQWFRRLPGLEKEPQQRTNETITHMIESGILHSDQGLLSMGAKGEKEYGRKNFMALLSVFTSPPLVKVFFGKEEIGEVHETTFAIKGDTLPTLTLGGRTWQLRYLDWGARKAYVEPSEVHGRSQWLSGEQPLSHDLCQAIPRILAQQQSPVRLSQRGLALLAELKEQHDGVSPGMTLIAESKDGEINWWTFAGKVVNAALSNFLAPHATRLSFTDLFITIKGQPSVKEWAELIHHASKSNRPFQVNLDENFIGELKFSECLTQMDVQGVISNRYDVEKEAEKILSYPISFQRSI
jgi:ATP-dependent Lhr-like helicase